MKTMAKTGSAPRRKRDKEATKEAILDSAERCFVARGVGETSLSEIAREAGVTKSLIHHHFDSKEKLWEAVKRRPLMDYLGLQLQILSRPEVDVNTFRQSVAAYFGFLKANPGFVRLMGWMALEGDCAFVEEQVLHFGVERLRQGQKQGTLRADLDPEMILATFLSATAHWFQERPLFLHWNKMDPEEADRRYLDNLIRILTHGISPRGSKADAD
jgi:TetR/AcrR family transcriptional regulator